MTLSVLAIAVALGQPPAGELDHRLERARTHERAGDLAAAEADYDRLVELAPENWRHCVARGGVRFRTGDAAGAGADFDRAVELEPESEPYLWQRGIAQYYLGRYRECASQFELHRTVNPNDVENAAWHFLCRSREQSFEAARRSLLPVGTDRRPPMREIYDLFAGRTTADAVLAAAEKVAERDRPLAQLYAYLYLGLYAEARGETERSREHIERAAELSLPGYMADVARVHLGLRD